MGILKKKCSFTLDESTVERMSYFADKQSRSLSNFLETILKKKLDQLENAEKKLTRKS